MRDRQPIQPRRDLLHVVDRRLLPDGSQRNLLHDLVHGLNFADAGIHHGSQPAVVRGKHGWPIDPWLPSTSFVGRELVWLMANRSVTADAKILAEKTQLIMAQGIGKGKASGEKRRPAFRLT